MARPRIVQLVCWSGAGSMSPDTHTPSSSVLLLSVAVSSLRLLDAPVHQRDIHHGGVYLQEDQPRVEQKGKARDKMGKIKIHNTLHT